MRAFPSRAAVGATAACLALSLAGCGDDGGSDDARAAGVDDSADSGDTSTDVLFPDDFKPVCQGATVSRATAYDETATAHKALYFASSDDALTERTSDLPGDWTVAFTPDADALAAIDVVLCAVRTGEELVQECTGYEDDGVDTGNTVNWHTATYEVSVRAATTGQVLAQETMEATDEACPSIVFFDEDGQTLDMYASIESDAAVAFLKPFVQP
jgi:hypothetical protein